MNKPAWQTLSSITVYDNPWIRVREDQVLNPAGRLGVYGVVEFKNRAVGVVPIAENGDIIMVRQTRYALGNQSSLEIPEGGCPAGENWLETARRELAEETGYRAGELQVLLEGIHLSNSVSNETGALFVATGLVPGAAQPEECEDIAVERHSLDALLAMIRQGAITDSLTIMALLLVAARRSDYGLR